ncbi:hypothetical protein Pla52o_58100 [Novipirellula galeiformis]|uniref:Uncharacterized protein n=1 Tax=Novipirellula galeiformis TaxID=2528004 RepID=A0A5C6BEJ9_9BACT|nr:hypothetical protein Pla52o_58100 [Novipirellula galeiformis]
MQPSPRVDLGQRLLNCSERLIAPATRLNLERIQMLKRKQFRVSTLLFVTALVAMACVIVVTRLELASLRASRSQSGVNASPISVDAVAASVEQCLASHPWSTSVADVRYSAAADSFKVCYEWTDPSDGRTWSSDVILKGNGFGEYSSFITNKTFLNPVQLQVSKDGPTTGNVGRMWVGVSAPSSLADGGNQ